MVEGDPIEKKDAATSGGEVLRGSFWLWLQQAADILLAFAFSWIALRRLGPAGFGTLTLLQALLNFTSLGAMNFEQVLLRDLPRFRSPENWNIAWKTWWWVLILKALFSGLAIIILWFSAGWVAVFFDYPDLLLSLRVGCISVFAAALAELGAVSCLALFHAQVRTIVTILRRSVEVGGIFILGISGLTLTRAIIVLATADCFAAAIYLAATLYLLLKSPKKPPVHEVSNPSMIRGIFSYSLPLMGARITDVSGKEIGKVLLGKLVGATELGYYGVARLISERLINFMAQAPLAAVPVLAARLGEDPPEVHQQSVWGFVERLMAFQVMAAGVVGLGIVAFAPSLVLIIGGKDYLPATNAVRSVALLLIIWGSVAPLHTLFMATGRTSRIFYLNLSQICATLILYLAFTPFWPVTGAGFADALGHLAALMLGLMLIYRWLGVLPHNVIVNLLRVSLPIPAFIVIIWLTQNQMISLLLLCLALWSYLSYLLIFQSLPLSLWEQVSQMQVQPIWLKRVIQWAARFLEGYQIWLLKRRRFS